MSPDIQTEVWELICAFNGHRINKKSLPVNTNTTNRALIYKPLDAEVNAKAFARDNLKYKKLLLPAPE